MTTYTYAAAWRRLADLGFVALTQQFGPASSAHEENLNDWLFASEIPELGAWFCEDRLPDRVFD